MQYFLGKKQHPGSIHRIRAQLPNESEGASGAMQSADPRALRRAIQRRCGRGSGAMQWNQFQPVLRGAGQQRCRIPFDPGFVPGQEEGRQGMPTLPAGHVKDAPLFVAR